MAAEIGETEPLRVARRPIPLIGDTSSAASRAASPQSWQLSPTVRDAFYSVLGARRDIRRYRPDPVPGEVLHRVLGAGHLAPSVGHSQPWRFLVVDDPGVRERAALMADAERLAQAASLDAESGRQLLDLQLEGIREAPLGVVVCCDRRTPAVGVLGRATFPDSDIWSCACAIENIWLAARAEGLGLGWVTLFRPDDLATLLGLPDGVVTLGWLCLGWPDELPPSPGLERAGWSRRLPLDEVLISNRWPSSDVESAPPRSRLRAPTPDDVVAARDEADVLLAVPSALGVLDDAINRVAALGGIDGTGGTLVLVAGRHQLAEQRISAYRSDVTDEVLRAARAGRSVGAVAAAAAGLAVDVVDAGTSQGSLGQTDPLSSETARDLIRLGEAHGATAAARGLVALGEIGIGNTTVAAALAASLLDLRPSDVVGLGSGADSAMVERKQVVIARALVRSAARTAGGDPVIDRLVCLGGPEFAYLTGVVLGAASAGGLVILDGLATGVAALLAVQREPAAAAHLVAGQRSRERAHQLVLRALGLEPLLDLRVRAGEGVGACLAAQLLASGLQIRRNTIRTAP